MSEMKDLDLREVTDQFSSTEKAIVFLREKGILSKDPPYCDLVGCGKLMTEIRRSELNDGLIWRCTKHKGRKKSIRSGSFLENQNIRLEVFLQIAHLWAYSTPVGVAQHWTEVSNKTAIQWYQYLRGICSVWLAANPVRLGGPGTIVQVDENLTIKEKDTQGRFVRNRYVFGMYDCQKSLGFFNFMDVRNKDTILPIILRHVLPGTEIHTNDSTEYLPLSAVPIIPPYTHLQVNHTQDFIDPVTGAHINNVKHVWKNVIKNKQMCATSAGYLASHVDEFMWRQIYGKETTEAFENILHHISVLYAV